MNWQLTNGSKADLSVLRVTLLYFTIPNVLSIFFPNCTQLNSLVAPFVIDEDCIVNGMLTNLCSEPTTERAPLVKLSSLFLSNFTHSLADLAQMVAGDLDGSPLTLGIRAVSKNGKWSISNGNEHINIDI